MDAKPSSARSLFSDYRHARSLERRLRVHDRFGRGPRKPVYSALDKFDSNGRREWISTASFDRTLAPDAKQVVNRVTIAPRFLEHALDCRLRQQPLIAFPAAAPARSQGTAELARRLSTLHSDTQLNYRPRDLTVCQRKPTTGVGRDRRSRSRIHNLRYSARLCQQARGSNPPNLHARTFTYPAPSSV
jgi:hypothetical protein